MNNCGGNEGARNYRFLNYETTKETSLAMAYVPWQHFEDVYEPDKALQVGTIFPELNKPFYGKRGGRMYES